MKLAASVPTMKLHALFSRPAAFGNIDRGCVADAHSREMLKQRYWMMTQQTLSVAVAHPAQSQ